MPKNFDPDLTDAELEAVRLKLAERGVRLVTYYLQEIPDEEQACRNIFEFGRKLGVETFMTEPKLEALERIDRFCNQYGIKVALHNHDQKASPAYWSPAAVLRAASAGAH
jgi:sugar phosphate isomerase/epimerase